MATHRSLSAVLALLLVSSSAWAQLRDGEWISYRDAYRAMVRFDKYGGAKQFLQNHLQVMAKEKGVGNEGLRLTLSSSAGQLNLPLDATGRAVFPLQKAAYDENAVLLLNRPAGQYVFRARVTVAVRADGVYEASDLRTACAQALGVLQYADASARSRHCIGLRFVFARAGAAPSVKVKEGESRQLPVVEGAPFADDPNDGYRVVNYSFADTPAHGQVVTADVPLAIAPLFD
jgi:hypothetical protein